MKGHTFLGIIIILIGLSILLKFPLLNVLFAFFIVWIGVKILTGKNKNFDFETKGILSEDIVNRVLVFSGMKVRLTSSNFKGGEIVTVFAGAEIDATGATSKEKDVDLDVASVFGGVKLKVPTNWQVKSEGVGILGGFDNSTKAVSKPVATLHVKGAAIFGGVEITN